MLATVRMGLGINRLNGKSEPFKEDALKAPSKAIILRKEASKLGPAEVNLASELLKKAIAINPEYTLAAYAHRIRPVARMKTATCAHRGGRARAFNPAGRQGTVNQD